MQNNTITFSSPTEQMKAYDTLRRHGINSVTGRPTDPAHGCIYTLLIPADYNRAVSLLGRKEVSPERNGGAGI